MLKRRSTDDSRSMPQSAQPKPSVVMYDRSSERDFVLSIARGRVSVDDILDAGLRVEWLGDPVAQLGMRSLVELVTQGREVSVSHLVDVMRGVDAAGAKAIWEEHRVTAEWDFGFGARWTASELAHEVELLRSNHQRRTLFAEVGVARERLGRGESADNVAADLGDVLDGLQRQGSPATTPLRAALDDVLAGLDRAAQVVSTGHRDLDRALNGGMRPGQLITVAGRPGLGKSAVALGMARSVAEAGQGVLFVTLEMTAADVATRLLAAAASLSVASIQDGADSPRVKERAVDATRRVGALPITFMDRGVHGIGSIRREAQRLARRGQLGLVVIDYLQLVPGEGRCDNRVAEVSALSRGVKLLALDLGVPVVSLSQLNRQVENRVSKRPMLADLRESGAIEQDSDAVLLLHRDSSTPGVLEIDIAKHRNGPLGSVRAAWRPDTLTLGLMAKGEAP